MMPRSVVMLMVLFLVLFLSHAGCVEARTLVIHRPMLSFAHFLYGTSGAFPPAAAFNRDLLRWKKLLDESTTQALDRVAAWFRAGVAVFPSEHAFETAYYQAAAESNSLEEFAAALSRRNIQASESLLHDARDLRQIFERQFRADPGLVDRELAKLNALPEMRLFGAILRQIEQLHRLPGQKPLSRLPYELVAIPLRLTPSEMQELRASGKNSIFGRSFGPLQVIELLIIPEVPDLSRKMLGHLLGVGLHEITHYLQAETNLGGLARRSLGGTDDPHATLASIYLFEGLATALGNGLFAEATRSADPQWYARDSINLFGHALLPLVKTWISAHKAIDREFCCHAREAFQRLFPAYQRRWEFAFARLRPHGSKSDWESVFEQLKHHLPSIRLAESSDPTRPFTNLHLIRRDDTAAIDALPTSLAVTASAFARLRRNVVLSEFNPTAHVFTIVLVAADDRGMRALIDHAFQMVWRSRFLCLPHGK